MRTQAQAGWAGALRWRRARVGVRRVGVPRAGVPRLGVPWPGGIRNGGLLLVLVALAAVMALVDRPPEPGPGRSLPGVIQHLPPPAGITGLPPAVAQPPVPAGSGAAALAGSGERPGSLDRAHPNRQHPRPGRAGSARVRSGAAASRPVGGGGGGGGQGGDGTSPPVTAPPVAAPPVAAPALQVQVPSVGVHVTPPALLGRDLPEVGAEAPAVTVATPSSSGPRLRLG